MYYHINTALVLQAKKKKHPTTILVSAKLLTFHFVAEFLKHMCLRETAPQGRRNTQSVSGWESLEEYWRPQ